MNDLRTALPVCHHKCVERLIPWILQQQLPTNKHQSIRTCVAYYGVLAFFVLLISSTIVFGIYPGFCGFVIPGTIGLVCCIIHLKREFLRRRRRRGVEIASEETRNSGTAQVATYSENSPLITSSTSAPTATPRQVDRSNLHEPPPSYVEATKSQSRYPLATPTAHEDSYSPPAYSQVRVWPS